MENNNYIEYTFKVIPLQPASDILIAELGEVLFESFVETEDGVLAYIKQEDWSSTILSEISILENKKTGTLHGNKTSTQFKLMKSVLFGLLFMKNLMWNLISLSNQK